VSTATAAMSRASMGALSPSLAEGIYVIIDWHEELATTGRSDESVDCSRLREFYGVRASGPHSPPSCPSPSPHATFAAVPSMAHEILVDLFKNRPSLAAEILVEVLGLSLPAYTEARLASVDLTEIQPAVTPFRS
jgi:hypothetical protein